MSADDDREIRARMTALEAEVRADADAARVRKEQALAKLRAQKAKQLEERAALQPKPKARPKAREEDDELDTAMMVAKGAKLAKSAKDEMTRPREKGEKSWLASSALSLFLGPLGWLYAGSLREAVPAGFLWLIAMAILSKLPWILVMPVIMVALPISAIGGFVYALQYNRHGKRMRLFDKDEKKKLESGD